MSVLPALDRPLRLFASAPSLDVATALEEAGVDGIVCDERHPRFSGDGIPAHVAASGPSAAALARSLSVPVTVRINRLHAGTAGEVERVVGDGAAGIALPGAHSAGEVETLVRLVRGRAATTVEIDTGRLADDVASLQHIGWDHLFVQLSVLAMNRNGGTQWDPLLDGTLPRVAHTLPGRPIGFGTLAVPASGDLSVPDVHLLHELAALGGSMAFLDASAGPASSLADYVAAVRAAWRVACRRTPATIAADHEAFRGFATASSTTEDARPPILSVS
jgi:hypothetical protein